MPQQEDNLGYEDSPQKIVDARREEVFPIRLLVITTGAIAGAEIIIHAAIASMPPMNPVREGFLDGLVTLLFMFPVFYWFSYHPLTRTIERRRKAEIALRASESQYRAIVEDQTEFIVRFSSLGTMTFANQAFSRLLGRDARDLYGESFHAIFSDIDQDRIQATLSQLDLQHPVTTVELCLPSAGQADTWILWTVRALHGEDTTQVSYQAVGLDITQSRLLYDELARAHEDLEKRVAERTLELSEMNSSLKAEIVIRQKAEATVRQQATALKAAANGIIITHLDGTIVWCNPAFSRMTGYSTDEVIGKKVSILNSGRHDRVFYSHLWDTILSGKVWQGEMINQRKDGSLYYEQQTITPVLDENNELISFIAIKQDVTERKRAEDVLKRRNWELEALNDVGNAVGGSLELDEVIGTLKKILSKQLGFPRGKIYTYQASDQSFSLQDCWGVPDEILEAFNRIHIPGRLEDLVQNPSALVKDFEQELIGRIPEDCRHLFHRDQSLCIPLLAQNSLQGILVLSRGESSRFSAIQASFYNTLANQIGAAIQNIRLYKAELRARQTAETLRGASLALSQSLNLETVLNTLLDYLGKLVPFDVGHILLMEDESHLVSRASTGSSGGSYPPVAWIMDTSQYPVFDTVLSHQQSMCIVNTDLLVEWRPLPGECARSWLGIPLVTGEKAIGVVSLEITQDGCFNEHHLELAEAMIGQGAIAVQNAWLFEQVRSGRERLQALSRRLVEVQETERRFIARELHDEASQILIYLKYGLDLLKRDAHQPEAVIAGIDELDGMASEVLDNLRRIAVDLRPASLDHLGLVPALRQYIEAVSDKHGLSIQFETRGVNGRLVTEVETCLYRIVQEALTNIVRHARADRVDVLLEQNEDKIWSRVIDNGTGFDPVEAMGKNRLGLFGMRERAEMLGGRFILESQPGTGTTILVEIPNANTHLNR